MNASKLTRQLLKEAKWTMFHTQWSEVNTGKKTKIEFIAMCIGYASDWFKNFLNDDEVIQIAEMEWVAGALIKQGMEKKNGSY